MRTITKSPSPGSRIRRFALLSAAALAVALLPGTNAAAVTVPLSLPPLTPPAPGLPAPSIDVLGGTSVPGTTGGGSSGGWIPIGSLPGGDAALTALGDPALATAIGDTVFGSPAGGSQGADSQQGPGANRGLSQQTAELDRQQAVMTAQVNALADSVDALEAAYAGGGSGRFAWPQQVRTISQGFGCTNLRLAPTNNQCPSGHFHTGLDIAGPNLADIHAADTGIARVFHGTTGYGNYVIITHGNGYATLYAHLNDVTVKDGQLVQRGDLVAHEGSTGNSTGPHLHFEVRLYGNYLDPCPFLEGCKGY